MCFCVGFTQIITKAKKGVKKATTLLKQGSTDVFLYHKVKIEMCE